MVGSLSVSPARERYWCSAQAQGMDSGCRFCFPPAHWRPKGRRVLGYDAAVYFISQSVTVAAGDGDAGCEYITTVLLVGV